MMFILRAIGSILLLIAAIAFLRDLVNWYDSGAVASLTGDQLWLSLSPSGYQAAQHWVADRLPVVLGPVAGNILALPVFLSAGVIGAFLRAVARRRRENPRWRRDWRRMYGG